MTTPAVSDPKFTDEQELILESPSPLVAVEAGAGCGKTFVLTERMLAHLDPTRDDEPPAIDEVVAITFTDAAAREMRDRVRRKCLDRMHAADGDASSKWLRLQRSLDTARVSTIHSFCGDLLRAHALSLGLDPAFAVLDQATAEVMLSEAMDASLREGLENQNETLIYLAAEFGITGLKQRLQAVLDVNEAERDAWAAKSPADLVAAWRKASKRLTDDVVAELRDADELEDAVALLHAATSPTEKFQPKRDWLLLNLPQVQSGDAGAERFADLAEALKLHASYKKCWDDLADYERYKAAAAKIKKRLGKLPQLAGEDELHRAADLGLALLREGRGVTDRYRAEKRAANSLDYDDLLREAHRLLTTPEYADVQRSLRKSVRLLLVDEFQDTDHLQSDIVRALVGLNAANDDGGRLFFVGDFKQSIYRFRGAEPAVFRDLQTETPDDGRLPLSMNFRSQPAVLDFVNHVFAEPFGDRYTALAASRKQVSPLPATELLRTTPPDEKANAEEKRQAEARAIARRLRELLDEQALMVADTSKEGGPVARPIRPGDIAILFQALSDVQHYEQALREQGIEYYLVGGHAFYAQQEVYDVLHLLRSIASGCDEVSLAGVLRSPMFALEDETLYWMAASSGSLNGAIVDGRAPSQLSSREVIKLQHARSVLAELRALKGRARTAEIILLALERTGYDASLLVDFLGERKLANLEKLIEQARVSDGASSSGSGDLDRFIRQLGEFTLRQPKEALASTSSEGANVVRLMTVHGAKGLEFPVVVVPDLGRKSQPDRRSAAFDATLGPLVKPSATTSKGLYGLDLLKRIEQPEEKAEALRKFYVACTRAADYLLLSAVTEGEPTGEWLTTLAGRYDLETGVAIGNGPSLSIVAGDASLSRGKSGGRRVDRLRLIEEARASIGSVGEPSSSVGPVAVRPESLRQFSVSRLTGQLHQGRERPEAVALQAALRSSRSEIDPRGLGTLVHAVIERLPVDPPLAAEQVAALCHELAPLNLRRHIDLAADEAATMVQNFVASDTWGAFNAATRFDREVEFVLAWPPSEPTTGEPNAWIRGYIDALVQDSAGQWRIVDYKTNRIDGGGVQDEADKYRLQLGVYALAVEKSLQVLPAGMQLCFLRPGVTVDFAWDAAAREETIARVTEAIKRVREDACS